MSYVLINGKRYYKDDRTGETTRDNVSQAVADQRARKNQQMAGRSSAAVNRNRTAHARTRRKAVIVCIVIAMFIAAFFYKYSHTSSEEQAAGKYMNAEQTQEISTGGEINYEIF